MTVGVHSSTPSTPAEASHHRPVRSLPPRRLRALMTPMTIARAPTSTAAGAKMMCAWAATETATITTGAQASRPDMSGHAAPGR